MNASEARKTFLEYFVEHGHTVLPSSSVIPHGDKTLLFTNAGMNQFKDIFTGQVKPKQKRATTAQKCIRAGGKHNDLDNVGYTSRHLTFFEMLGNFSFGDYFKEEAIAFAWELITRRFGIEKERLWITVYDEDDQARKLWRKVAGVPAERVVRLGRKDNFWSMGDVGPCGPCSEILLDRGDAFGVEDIENGERFFEIWNLVFMQFEQQRDGAVVPLPRPSIDTGMGLERLLMVLQDVDTVFETDILRGLIRQVEEISGVDYDSGPAGVPHRVLADHVRSLVFAFADGAEPSNEGRGYVLRRILRRAARYGRKIHAGGTLLSRLVDHVVEEMGEAFGEIVESRDSVTQLIRREEERFGETLDHGLELFEGIAGRLEKSGKGVVPGDDVFKLYDTFGFPVDLVEQMALERDLTVDLEGFRARMAAQKERSRGASRFQAGGGVAGTLELASFPESRFVGYEEAAAASSIQAVASEEDDLRVLLEETPFYAEGGGQVGDTGEISSGDFRLQVVDTQKERGRFVHVCRLLEGDRAAVRAGHPIAARIDVERRRDVERNHTATHLLHAALRQVLGAHVRQKGSLVEAGRLRFDVTHFSAIASEEIAEAEDLVRREIRRDAPVETFETDYDEAVAMGAMALFGEKYGDVVRVVRIGEFSVELCGGTHVGRCGEIGPFLVAGEGSVSSGVRRLEALTAAGADDWLRQHMETLLQLSALLKVKPEAAVERVEKLLAENRELKKRPRPGAGERAVAGGGLGERAQRETIGEVLVVSAVLEDADGKALRAAYDRLKTEGPELVAAVFSHSGKDLRFLVGVSQASRARGIDARKLFAAASPPLEGRGGGRPELAQGGGVYSEDGVEKAIAAVKAAVASQIGRRSSS